MTPADIHEARPADILREAVELEQEAAADADASERRAAINRSYADYLEAARSFQRTTLLSNLAAWTAIVALAIVALTTPLDSDPLIPLIVVAWGLRTVFLSLASLRSPYFRDAMDDSEQTLPSQS